MPTRRSLIATLAAAALRGQSKTPRMFSDAEAYERFMGRWSRMLAPLLVDFAAVPESGHVLDVGSGTGVLAFSIAERKPKCRVTGIDPATEYVAYAGSQNKHGGRVAFEIGDAQQLRFPRASFDACVSLLVVNFIPDRRKALLEMERVTKRGGSISAAVWDYGDGMRMLRVFWDAVVSIDPGAAQRAEKTMPLCRAGELAAFWKESGLRNVVERPLDIRMRFASFADYWDAFLLGQGPAGAYLKGVDKSRREAIRADVLRRLRLTAESDPFTLPARAWAVRGITP